MQNTLEEAGVDEFAGIDTTGAYADLRAKYNGLITTLFVKEKISSASEVKQLESWLDSIKGDGKAIQEAQENFQKYAVPLLEKELQKKNHAVIDLQNALQGGVISKSSYAEWMNWMEDSNRDSQEKMESMAKTLPPYLNERRELAMKREAVIGSKAFSELEQSKDPTIKGIAAKISDNNYFLNTLNFEERKKAVTEAQAMLPIALEEQATFAAFEAQLVTAMQDGLINADSKKKWVARFKDPAINSRARVYFVQNQFPSYLQGWKKVKAERKTIKENPLFKELTEKEVKDLKSFDEDSKFIALHHSKKNNLISQVKAAIDAKKNKMQSTYARANSILTSAVAAGIMSANKVGGWLELIMSGKKTLGELESKTGQWAKLTSDFEKIELRFMTEGVPQGLQTLSKEQFLMLSTKKREGHIERMKQRLDMTEGTQKNTPIQDAKGKVQHALDQKNWEEARHYLQKAWPLAQNEEDMHDLRSMESYIQSVGSTSGSEGESNKAAEIQNAQEEITAILKLLPVGLQPIYRKALQKGPECLQCVTTCVYNRTWCEERGYLDETLEEKLREKSIHETQDRIRAGGDGHGHGRENNFVDGFNQPAIRDSGICPQNLFMSSSGADAFVEQADANKNTFTFWYWTNLIVDGVSSSQNSYVAYNLNWRIKSAARTLDKHGLRYSPLLNIAGPKDPSVN